MAPPILPTEEREAAAQATLLFRIQCTLFCAFYTGLLFVAAVYFQHRMATVTEAIGNKPGPAMLEFARHLHHPFGLAIAGAMAIVLLLSVWSYRPNKYHLFGQAILMVMTVLFAFLPPVATEITTSTILQAIVKGAREKGLIQ